jgi:hypothetical protein
VAIARVGRILTTQERDSRISDEAAASIKGEILRSAFAISNRHVLTAWHCVSQYTNTGSGLWLRLRSQRKERHYDYLPIRVSNYDTGFDVAVLAIDYLRLQNGGLAAADAERILAGASIPLGVRVQPQETVKLIGFPASASSADSDTNDAKIVDTNLPLGAVTGMKLFGEAFAAVSPVDPHGLSGAPVLRILQDRPEPHYSCIGIVRAIARGDDPSAAAGGGIIATRISDVVNLLPEVAVVLSRTAPPEAVPSTAVTAHEGNLLTLFRTCSAALQDSVVRVEDTTRGNLVGWAHFFDESPDHLRPTAISTAYGLKLTLALDQPDGSLSRSALAETLWRLRLSDGGWTARTGTGVGRPETTALVLGALAAAGYDQSRLNEAGEVFERALSRQADHVARDRTYTVCAAIRGLVRARPASPRLVELKTDLIDGAIADATDDDLMCWGNLLKPAYTGSLRPVPSVAHTAMAIVALARANLVLGQDEVTESALDQAIRWLCGHPDLQNRSESIRRFVREHSWELLNVDHFTAAWVARALLAVQPPRPTEAWKLLNDSIWKVRQSQRNGIWEWEPNDRPVWMTYQGMCVLQAFAARIYPIV